MKINSNKYCTNLKHKIIIITVIQWKTKTIINFLKEEPIPKEIQMVIYYKMINTLIKVLNINNNLSNNNPKKSILVD